MNKKFKDGWKNKLRGWQDQWYIHKTCSGCYASFYPQRKSLTDDELATPAFLCEDCKKIIAGVSYTTEAKGNEMEKINEDITGVDDDYFKNQRKIYEANGRMTGNQIPEAAGTVVKERKNADQPEDHWDSELETVKDCSKSPEEIIVWIKPLAKVQIDALMEKYPNIEWFAYLLGDGEDKFTVEKIHVPTQKITTTSVDEIECPEYNKIPVIGAIHSHHGMGTGFSGTDHAFVNQNHDISLVISKATIAGQVRWSTPCGCLKIVSATVKPKIEVDFDKKSFLEMAVGNIKEKTFAQSQGTTYSRKHPQQQTWPPGQGPGKSGPEVISGIAGTWVNGVWRPNDEVQTAAQRSYTNGQSVKEAVKEDADEQIPVIPATVEEQSLMEALDEAFPEEKIEVDKKDDTEATG